MDTPLGPGIVTGLTFTEGQPAPAPDLPAALDEIERLKLENDRLQTEVAEYAGRIEAYKRILRQLADRRLNTPPPNPLPEAERGRGSKGLS